MIKKVITIVGICALIYGVMVFVLFQFFPDPMDSLYKDTTEYPLAKVDVSDDASYMLVKTEYGSIYEVTTDTELIKANAAVFRVDNYGSLYGTTPDGLFALYKDGEPIDTAPFDRSLTKKIEYGTLAFEKVNELQYLLLRGAKIIEEGANHTILCMNADTSPYYYCFAHGDDLTSLDTVMRVYADSSIEKVPKPQNTTEGIIEFVADFPTYAGAETAHWFFRIADQRLSKRMLNVKAVRDEIVVYTDSGGQGPVIVISDMFDKKVYYKVIGGAYSQKADRLFLKEAVWTDDGELAIQYIGEDEQVHSDLITIK